jgi:hypothetical protein
VVCLRKKKITSLSQRGLETLEKFRPVTGSLSLVNSEVKRSILSTNLIDFNARLVGSAITPKSDLAIYDKKGKTLVLKTGVL